MYIEDLSTPDCTMRWVGWLDDIHPFTKGEVPAPFFARLLEHARA